MSRQNQLPRQYAKIPRFCHPCFRRLPLGTLQAPPYQQSISNATQTNSNQWDYQQSEKISRIEWRSHRQSLLKSILLRHHSVVLMKIFECWVARVTPAPPRTMFLAHPMLLECVYAPLRHHGNFMKKQKQGHGCFCNCLKWWRVNFRTSKPKGLNCRAVNLRNWIKQP